MDSIMPEKAAPAQSSFSSHRAISTTVAIVPSIAALFTVLLGLLSARESAD
jgi:hypothetical protein